MEQEKYDSQSSVLEAEFPCGYIDDNGDLHKSFIVRELSGDEEDILASKGDPLKRLNRVIANCLRSIGTITEPNIIQRAVWYLSASDRMTALVAIRRVSIGNKYRFSIQCDNDQCGKQFNQIINLDQLEIIDMEEPSIRNFNDKTSTNVSVKWHLMNATDEAWLIARKKKLSGEADVTLSMLARIDEVDGITFDRDASNIKPMIRNLKSLSSKTRREIRDFFKKREGRIDTEIEVSCPECDNEMKVEMEISADFFFPTGESIS